jgi:hypothetical protein
MAVLFDRQILSPLVYLGADIMPKDLTKLSLKEFDIINGGESESRSRWQKGTLELTVSKAWSPYDDEEEFDED